MSSFLGIIPARYASSRFPGKPLAEINGKPMIQHVFERAKQAIEHVVVATDDRQIFDTVSNFGGNVVMTSTEHQSGTDRCYEALEIFQKEIKTPFDVVINIQGDEPFIRPDQIELLKTCFTDLTIDIATLIKQVTDKSIIFDPNKPKVVVNKEGVALYFSRSPIPFIRGIEENNWLENNKFYQHIGMYAYRTGVLSEITQLKVSSLEKAESLEQLRWLQNGYKIKTAETLFESFGIDTPEDLEKALKQRL
jgi:3-deoxy-manno-octulosonate cytidylyltransferase (CMP-KDO synthetase)